MMEQVCEHGPCDGDTQQCPLSAHWDAGWVDPDLNSDNDNDGILNGDDEYPDHNNDDLQFIIDLIEQSGLSVAPLDLGEQSWENGRLFEANFSGISSPERFLNPYKS